MVNRLSEKSHYSQSRIASTTIGAYLRITDIVIDYFISFHSSHIVPIHLIGRHIKYTVTLMPVTTSVVQRVRLEVAEVSADNIGGRRRVTVFAAHTNAHAYARSAHTQVQNTAVWCCKLHDLFLPKHLHTKYTEYVTYTTNTHARARTATPTGSRQRDTTVLLVRVMIA